MTEQDFSLDSLSLDPLSLDTQFPNAQFPEPQFPELQFPEPQFSEPQFPNAQFPEPQFPEPQFPEITPPDRSQNASVLIVDDEKALRLILRRAMEGEGYRTIATNSAEHCLYLCQRQLPDVILLDAVMPGMDGFWCCSQLKSMFGDRCPAILMITALYDQQSIDKAFAAGATDFITKPIHWAILRQRVKRLLETCQLTAQWQTAIQQEKVLKDQLASAMQRIEYLSQLCQSNGIL